VRYRGQIGEFKLRGFVVALALCLSFALSVYHRFRFVTQPSQEDIKTTADATALRVKQLDEEVELLRLQVARLQDQLSTGKSKKK
jgi:hypothetical protein